MITKAIALLDVVYRQWLYDVRREKSAWRRRTKEELKYLQ